MKKFVSLTILASLFVTAQAQITWADDVATIFYQHCTSCHHDNGLAPSSFITYNGVFNDMYPIGANINSGIMPPWPPDPTYNHLAHERILTATEISTINTWITTGATQGNMANAPTPPVYNNSAAIQNPDFSFNIPTYTVDTTADVYRCFPVPTGINIDEFITQLEVIPGNPSIVHHVLVFADTSNICFALDAAAPGPGYTDFGGVGTESAYLLGTWVPGSQPSFLPNGLGYKLLANSNIILQVHYPAGSIGETDSTQVRFKFSSGAVRNVYDDIWLYHDYNMTDGPLVILPNTTRTFHEAQVVPFSMTLLDVFPHMHLIGKKIKVCAVTPVGDTINLININNWDFHWQGAFQFRHAIKIPAYSTLYSEAFYDNTTANPNITGTPQLVTAGEATTDEMMLTFFSWMYYQAGDENIILDSTAITSTNDWIITDDENEKMSCYPVPSSNEIQVIINANQIETGKLSIQDMTGKTIEVLNNNFELTIGENEKSISISNLAAGNYFLIYQNENHQLVQKFVKQ